MDKQDQVDKIAKYQSQILEKAVTKAYKQIEKERKDCVRDSVAEWLR
jgi:hypothetical protein